MIISAIQNNPKLSTCYADVTDNRRKCEDLIHKAWQVGSEIIVFPELAFTGCSFLNQEEAFRVAEPKDGPTYKFMKSVATTLQSYMAWGFVEVDDGLLYNSASIIDPSGNLVASYRKINLFSTDFLWAKPGKEPAPVVQTEHGFMSVITCRDLRDEIPESIPRTARTQSMFERQKIDVVAACVNWGKGGFPATSWMDFTADNKLCVLAVANRWGKEEGSNGYTQNFGHGGSCIIEPDWTVHTSGLKFNQDCVVTAIL